MDTLGDDYILIPQDFGMIHFSMTVSVCVFVFVHANAIVVKNSSKRKFVFFM